MIIPNDSLRLILKFTNALKRVEVLALTHRVDGPPLLIMGMVEGEEGVENLLDSVGIDHHLVTCGEPFTPSFKSMAYALSPKLIARSLKEVFAKAEEIPYKILRGEKLTADEVSFEAPKSLTFCASRVPKGHGVESVATWFKMRNSNN
jgi:hypothetical protein